MMSHRRSHRRVLGLALAQNAMHVAEVRTAGSGVGRVTGTADFPFPQGIGWETPQALGEALGGFLKARRLGGSVAIVGLPRRWLLARPHALPPADPATAAAILRLAIEREFPAQSREWVFDVAGEFGRDMPRTLLLCATSRQRLDEISMAMAAADLRLAAVTVTSLALAEAAGAGRNGQAVIFVGDEGTELAIVQAGQVPALERLLGGEGDEAEGVAPARTFPGTELRRHLTSAASRLGQPVQDITVWSSQPDAESLAGALLADLGGQVKANPPIHGLTPGDQVDRLRTSGQAAAAVVALSGLGRGRPPVDFLHSRLATAPPRRMTLRRAAGVAAVLALVAAVAFFTWDWRQQQQQTGELRFQLDQLRPQVNSARANISRAHLAGAWFGERPPMLDCLRELTRSFPASGRLWATSLAIRDERVGDATTGQHSRVLLSGTLAGKAPERETVLDLLDRLRGSRRFAEPKLLYIRQDDRTRDTVAFALTFQFVLPETR